jgi:hypothetical protein
VRELANVAERQVLGLDEPVQGIDPGQSLAAQQEAFEAQCLRGADPAQGRCESGAGRIAAAAPHLQ